MHYRGFWTNFTLKPQCMKLPLQKYILPFLCSLLALTSYCQTNETTNYEIVHFVNSSAPTEESDIYFRKVSKLVRAKILKSIKASPEIKGKEVVLFVSIYKGDLEKCKLVKGITPAINQQILDVVNSIDFTELSMASQNSKEEFLIPIKFGNISS